MSVRPYATPAGHTAHLLARTTCLWTVRVGTHPGGRRGSQGPNGDPPSTLGPPGPPAGTTRAPARDRQDAQPAPF
ncbi:hypothetical protein STAFG_7782 [Streptomyces afghaniensis 772]|uniref:Uncharacterized protein n=1 Tax=Streptomyces afghaniensis 772 TaxID=1283301 RepID=S4MI08_9ACTN|nr:hypothetical protein STAFG_7782 [Streptomyces afghaniensis 772]